MVDHLDVVRITTRATFPVVLIFAAEHIVNATEAPGEGFSGGLLVALAILLLYVGIGYREIEDSLPALSRWGVTTGLAIALGTGLLGFLTGRGFLGSASFHTELAGGNLHLSTAALFDLGIFFVVSSGALAIFRAVGTAKEEER